MTEEKRKELEEVFKRVCVCRSFRLTGLAEILKKPGFEVESVPCNDPVKLIWLMGDLSANGYVKIKWDKISDYIVSREKADAVIPTLTSPSFCELHDVWRTWYERVYKKHFKVEDLAALMYHETAFFKCCPKSEEDAVAYLEKKSKDLLSEYFKHSSSVANSLSVTLSPKQAPPPPEDTFIEDSEVQEEHKKFGEYISALSERIEELQMFKGVFSPPENEAFLRFLNSLKLEKEEA